MPSHRTQRLNGDMQKELSMLIQQLKDPRITAFLSVMRCEVTSDLSYCKVLIGSINGYEDAAQACEVLKKASGFLRSGLSKNLRIRKAPELIFIPDDSAQYYEKINRIIDELEENEGN